MIAGTRGLHRGFWVGRLMFTPGPRAWVFAIGPNGGYAWDLRRKRECLEPSGWFVRLPFGRLQIGGNGPWKTRA